MKADVGTKPVGPARLLDLVKMMGMESDSLEMPSIPPNPKVSSLSVAQGCVVRIIVALLGLSQIQGVTAAREQVIARDPWYGIIAEGFLFGLGSYLGWEVARTCRRAVVRRLCRVHSHQPQTQVPQILRFRCPHWWQPCP